MITGFVIPQGIEWLYLFLWVGLAMIVIIGLTPDERGNALASPMYSPRTPKTSPFASHTAVRLSCPIRHVPIWCALNNCNRFLPTGAFAILLQI